MDWRNIFIGAFVTLIVTIIGGIVVFYLTNNSPATEKLIYTVTKSATFGETPSEFSVLEFDVKNVGRSAAHNISFHVDLGSGYIVNQKQVVLTEDDISQISDHSKGEYLDLQFPNLFPSEALKVSVMVNGNGVPNPSAQIHSDSTVAISEALPTDTSATKRVEISEKIIVLLFILLVAQAILLRSLRFLLTGNRLRNSMNNGAFLLLQKGLIEEAKSLLTETVLRTGTEPILIANEALACGLQNDFLGASKRFEIAEWWANWIGTRHEQAIIAYDRAIVALHENDLTTVSIQLERGLKLSRVHVSKYCELNELMLLAIQNNGSLKELIHRYKKRRRTDFIAFFR